MISIRSDIDSLAGLSSISMQMFAASPGRAPGRNETFEELAAGMAATPFDSAGGRPFAAAANGYRNVSPRASHDIRPCQQTVKKLTAAAFRPKQRRRFARPNFPSNLCSSSRQALCRPNMSRKAGRIKG